MPRRLSADWILFFTAIGLYLTTRFIQLDRFPIYFFCDEASIVVLGSNLAKNALKGSDGVLLPLYFDAADGRWQPILPVYFYTVVTPLLGKSILVARGMSVLAGTLAPVAVCLILRFAFRLKFWWAGALLLAASPAWFLHSRTAFQTVAATAFFACFLLAYVVYRDNRPRFLYAVITTGALTFYSYSAAQISVMAAASCLLVIDLRYHFSCLKDRRLLAGAAALAVILSLPLAAYLRKHPAGYGQHLSTVHSYWSSDLPPASKLARFAATYASGFSPTYWFLRHERDLVRHQMKGFAHLPMMGLPFFLLGAAMCVWRVHTPAYRVMLIALLAAPVGAAMYEVLITRVLMFVVPATILIALGIEAAMEFVAVPGTRWKSALLFASLAVGCLLPFQAALRNGALWFRDYGLYGMQYGTRELFTEAIPQYLREHPDAKLYLSPTWSNGAEWFPYFFDSPPQVHRFERYRIDDFSDGLRPIPENMVLIATAEEFDRAKGNPKFDELRSNLTISNPDGTPGFHFVPLRYSAEASPMFSGTPAESNAVDDPKDLFDGKPVKFSGASYSSPLFLDFPFSKPRQCSGLKATLGAMRNVTLTARLHRADKAPPVTITTKLDQAPGQSTVNIEFGPVEDVVRVQIEIRNNAAPIHLRELHLR